MPTKPQMAAAVAVGVAVLALVAAGSLAAAGTLRSTADADSPTAGPTAKAVRRDLSTTETATGTLQRAGETTITYTAGAAGAVVLTGVLGVGETAERGTVLFRVAEAPVVALLGDLPFWRPLDEGVAPGADVRQLEENLVALGYGSDLLVDDTFDAGTAAAVEAWEFDLGRAEPDGVVQVGDAVAIAAPGEVLRNDTLVGDALEGGSPVLTLGSPDQVVVADVPVADAPLWTAGAPVTLRWSDDTTSAGVVASVGRDVVDDRVEVVVSLGEPVAGRPNGSQVDVASTSASRSGVVAVPVAAVAAGSEGRPSVRVVDEDRDRVVPVELGLVADQWVEITAGIDEGTTVRLP